MNRHFRLGPLSLTTLASACVLACALCPSAHSQTVPTGMTVTRGTASATLNAPGDLTVTAAHRTVLDWAQFSIGEGGKVQFNLPDSSSRVLNRVTGGEASQLLGSLSSNGRVWLLNPAGLLIGQGATINVAGFVGGVATMNADDFVNDRFRFQVDPAATGNLLQQGGTITTTTGGQVLLFGPRVSLGNTSVIQAPGGQVALLAGQDLEAVDVSMPYLAFRGRFTGHTVGVDGQIDSTRIDVQGGIVNQQGTLTATALTTDARGQIVLKASDSLDVQGTLQAQSESVDPQALAGQITLIGPRIQLRGRVEVQGPGNGGQIDVGLAGTDELGQAHDKALTVEQYASSVLSASASAGFQGGTIRLDATQSTTLEGDLFAGGGRGGVIDTFSDGTLSVHGSLDVSGQDAGVGGAWRARGTQLRVSEGGRFELPNPDGVIVRSAVNRVLNTGGTAILQSTEGDLVFKADITTESLKASNLTLSAAGQVNVQGSFQAFGDAPLNLSLLAGQSASTTGQAFVILNNPIDLNGGELKAAGQALLIGGQANLSNLTLAPAGSSLLVQVTGNEATVTNTRLAPGLTLDIGAEATWTWQSDLDLAGSTLVLHDASQLYLAGEGLSLSAGTVRVQGAQAEIGGTGFLQDAQIELNGPAASLVLRDMARNTGTIVLQGGTLQISSFTQGSDLFNEGTLTGPGTIDLGQSGTLVNSGRLGNVGGGVSGTLDVLGQFSQTERGTLQLQGLAAANQPAMRVLGTASLAGVLQSSPAAGSSATRVALLEAAQVRGSPGSWAHPSTHTTEQTLTALSLLRLPGADPAPPTRQPPTDRPWREGLPKAPADPVNPGGGGGSGGPVVKDLPETPWDTLTPPAAGTPGPGGTTPVNGRPVLDDARRRQLLTGGDLTYLRPLPVSRLTREELTELLGARKDWKADVLAQGLMQVDAQPELPDTPECAPPASAEGGQAGGQPATEASQSQGAREGHCLLLTPPITDESLQPRRPRRHALVIGLNDYEDTRIPQLIGALADAQLVAGTLERDMGFQVTLLANAGKRELIAALNALQRDLRGNDSLLVYFAGHGEMSRRTGLGYWIPSDARVDDARTWFSNADLARWLSHVPARQLTVVSDSCYSGAMAGQAPVQALSQAPEDLLRHRAVTVMTSGSLEPVADTGEGGHSVFAISLLKHWQTLDALTPGLQVFERVRLDVERDLPQTPRYGAAHWAGHEAGSDYLFSPRSH